MVRAVIRRDYLATNHQGEVSMWSKPTFRSTKRYGGIACILLLSSALSLPADAMEKWKINMAKSHFSSGSNTLVLERDTGPSGAALKGNPAAGTFLVIAGDKLYVATDESAFDAATGKTIKTVDYNRWKEMKIVQLGEKVRTNDVCSFHCQSGLPDDHRTLTFRATAGDPTPQMRSVVVLNDW